MSDKSRISTAEEEQETVLQKQPGGGGGGTPDKWLLKKHTADREHSVASTTCCNRFTQWGFLLFFRFLFKFRYSILVLWIASLPFAGFFALKFLNATKLEFQAPKNTDAYNTRMAFNQYFPTLSTTQQMVVLVQGPAGKILNDTECAYLDQISTFLNNSARENAEIKDLFRGFLGPSFLDADLVSNAKKFLNKDPRTMFTAGDFSAATIVLQYQRIASNPVPGAMRKILKDFKVQNCSNEASSQYYADITGFDVMMVDLATNIEEDASKMDFIAIPLALIVFWFFLKSIRMLLLPLCSMVSAILYSFALMYPIAAQVFSVSMLAPTVMTSVIVAISTDYTLFLLTRFNDERKNKEIDMAIVNMVYFAGHVIVTSGITLAVTFASMMFYPTTFLQSFGAGTTIGIICAILCNLVLSPALLLCFPNFFTGSCFNWKRCCKKSENPQGNYEVVEEKEKGKSRALDTTKLLKEQRDSKWYKWVKLWDTPARSILIILIFLGVTIPVIYFLKDFNTTTDTSQLFAYDSPSIITLNNVKKTMNAGLIAPYYVMIVAKNKTEGVISQSYWDINQDLIDTMNARNLTGNSTVLSLTVVQGIPLKPADAAMCLSPTPPTDPSKQFMFQLLGAPYKYVANQLLNEDRTAALTSIIVDFDPLSRHSEKWIQEMRDLIANYSNVYPDHEFYIYGGSVEVVDLVSSVMRLFPLMIGITCAVVFLIVGFTFNSIIIPIRGLVTIGLSVGWTFGLSVIFFVDLKNLPLFWIAPVFCFSVVVGLGLDYDIFLLSRIHEYRDAGFSTTAAIVKGTSETGSIITGAGTIMMIAFISLSVSHIEVIGQIAFILTSAVFLDTFVVRTAMVPAMMRLCGWLNWWPSKFGSAKAEKETGVYGENYFLDEEAEDEDAGEEEDSMLVAPHDLATFLQRKSAIEEIIRNGHAGCFCIRCANKDSRVQKKKKLFGNTHKKRTFE